MDDDAKLANLPPAKRVRYAPEPRVSFAAQVMTGPTGTILRRRSSVDPGALALGKSDGSAAAAAASIQKSIAMGEFGLDDLEEEKEDSKDEEPKPSIFGARRMSTSEMTLLGIQDKTSQSLFMST